MVFHWGFSDSKSSQVSMTLLSILVVFNNVVVWILSNRPPTSESSSPFNNPLVTVPKAPITFGIIDIYMFQSFVNSLARLRYFSFFSRSFRFILWSAGIAKSTILQVLHFFVHYDKVSSFRRDQVIRLSVKVLSEFMCVIFKNRCWVVYIPFVAMVKFKFLAHFPVRSPCLPSRVSANLLHSLYYYYYYYYYYLLIRVFHISVSWSFFTGDWVTASLLKSPGLFSVFWLFSIMLCFRWSPLIHQFPSPPVPIVIL